MSITKEDPYGLGGVQEWSSFAFICVLTDPVENQDEEELKNHIPIGHVFVIDPKFGASARYKLPAGRRQACESPLETAVREMREETGIDVSAERFRYLAKALAGHGSGQHWRVLFLAIVYESELQRGMHDLDPGNEGEQPKFFSRAEFEQCVKSGEFMSAHYKMLTDCAAVLDFA